MKFHHKDIMYVKKISLDVKDLSIMKDYYLKVFGFNVLSENAHQVIFSADGTQPLLELNEKEDAVVRRNTFGLYHIAYLLPKRSDLASFVIHLSNLKVQFGAGDHIVSEAIYFEDPEGNGIEVYADRDSKDWVWEQELVKMDTLPVNFDDLLKESFIPYKKIPKDTVIGHIHLSVDDLEENRVFYIDTLGFQVVSKFQNSAYFTSDQGYHHHIAFNTWNRVLKIHPDKNYTGLKSMVLNMLSQDIKDKKECIDPNGIKIYFE